MTRPKKENPTPSEADGTSRRHNRRQALGLAGVAAAAAAVAALGMNGGKKAHAASGAPLILGQVNEADPGDGTQLLAEVDGHESALAVRNDGTGTGIGVAGGHLGIFAQSSNTGLWAESLGDTPSMVAFSGLCKGFCAPDGRLALEVIGKVRFSTAGAGVVAAKAYTAAVSNPAVTTVSHITVTFTGDPGRARVAWVERHADTGFTVHMSSRPRSAVPFTYLIVEPGV